jgi:hypothetical protein
LDSGSNVPEKVTVWRFVHMHAASSSSSGTVRKTGIKGGRGRRDQRNRQTGV